MAGKFTMDVTKFVDKYKIRLDLVIKKIVFDLVARIVLRSPVDTGRFRANWMVASGEMNVSTTENKDKTKGGTPTIGKLGQVKITAGESVFITNSLPYAIPLENGHSKQAPHGMVRITVLEFSNVVEQATQEVKAGS